MQISAFRAHPAICAAALMIAAFTAAPAAAVIMKLTPLAEVLETEDFIFVAKVDKVDPDKPSATFKLDKNLKGEAPFERIPVNMTGNAEAQKNNDTKTVLDRLDNTRKVVFFISKRGKKYNAMAFVEGSWFAVQGTVDDTDKTVRWAFQSGEPFLRRTFKGTSAELIQVLEDGIAKKAKPPAPDEKEKPGYGPPSEKKCEAATSNDTAKALPGSPVPTQGLALFGVIPSFVLVGPLAIVAALFPGVFARLAVGMKRWRAFLVIASFNSTVALVYFFTQQYLPSGRFFGTKAVTCYLMAVDAIGLVWAGLRYRRFAAQEPDITSPPARTELYILAGLTAFAAISACCTAAFANWETNLELPMREFTFIGFGLLACTLYATYRAITAHVDCPSPGVAPTHRLSLSGEAVGLATLFLCGLATVLQSGPATALASGTETGEADAIGPRLVSAKVFEVPKAKEVLSSISIVGDRLYFGVQMPQKLSSQDGFLACMNRETGELIWKFNDDDSMLPVFCTPRVVDGKVYCGEGLHENKDCRLFCLDASDGKPAWAQPFKTTSHTEGSPAVAGGKVFFPAGDDGLFAVDAKSGSQLWQFPGGKAKGIHVDAAPSVSGKSVFIGSGLYSFVAVCLDADTGNEKWRADLKLRAFAAPLILGKQIFYGVGTGNMGADIYEYKEEDGARDKEPAGAIVCLDIESGRELWRHDLPRSVHTSVAGDAFSVYACSRDGSVYAIDRTSGKLRWKTGIGGAITSAPAVAAQGGLPVAVYACSREGLAVCLNPHTGKIVWQKQLPGFQWDGKENDVLSGPAIASTPTPTGSKRAIYIGAMTVDPDNLARKTCAVFRFEDVLGDD